MSDIPLANSEKWTEIEHLPEWDEEFYLVYTAKKYGKWLMLKTLRPEFRDLPEYKEMLSKEFDVRYNLAHPNIIMINDLEEVPGLGMCIITDDVYGDSLQKLIDKGEVNEDILEKVTKNLVSALEYIQTNHIVHHPLTTERIIFTENIRNLKMIDVGFDQKHCLSASDAKQDIYDFGVVLNKVLDVLPDKHPELRRIAVKCMAKNPARRYRDIHDLKNALNKSTQNKLYLTIIIFLLAMIAIILWLESPLAPQKPEELQHQIVPATVSVGESASTQTTDLPRVE